MASTSKAVEPATDPGRWNPWRDMFEGNPRLSQLFDTLRHSYGDDAEPGGTLEETDDEFVLELDLPGVAKEAISVDVSGRRVSVHGSRTEKKREGALRHSTRTTGTFSYELQLPTPVDDSAVSASLDAGVLSVRMPKADGAKPTRIPIK